MIQNTKIFIHENAFENVVCEMAAILSRGMSWGSWQGSKESFTKSQALQILDITRIDLELLKFE